MARAARTTISDPARGDLAWALVAVSSEQQSETLPHQRQWVAEIAGSHGWQLGRVIEGVASGREGPRRIVRELMAELRSLEPASRPKVLCMIRADRLGRGSIVDSQIVLRDLQQLGINVFTRDQGLVRLDSAMAELISAATLAVAAHENEIRSEKMTSVYRRRRAAGETVGNRPPYGLLRKGAKLAADGKRATAVRQAFKLRLQGTGYDPIGRKLRESAPPQVFKNGRTVDVIWTPTRVMRLLSNPHYIGTLVSQADFVRAQRVAETLATADRSGDRRRRWPWPLAGVLRCYCGRMMIGTASGTEPHRTRYYGCRANWNHDVSVRLVRADSLEEQFTAVLQRLRASPKLIGQYHRRATAPISPKVLERKARELKKQIDDLTRKRDTAWEMHAKGNVRKEDLQERLDGLARERDELQADLGAVTESIAIATAAEAKTDDLEALFKRAASLFSRSEESLQRELARAVAVELGGLYVDEEKKLQIGASPVDGTTQESSRKRPPVKRQKSQMGQTK